MIHQIHIETSDLMHLHSLPIVPNLKTFFICLLDLLTFSETQTDDHSVPSCHCHRGSAGTKQNGHSWCLVRFRLPLPFSHLFVIHDATLGGVAPFHVRARNPLQLLHIPIASFEFLTPRARDHRRPTPHTPKSSRQRLHKAIYQ